MVKIKQFFVVIAMVVKINQFLVLKIKQFFVVITMVVKINQFLVVSTMVVKIKKIFGG